MEEWMKLLACASHDYMKLMVYELQQKLAELDSFEAAVTTNPLDSRICDYNNVRLPRYVNVYVMLQEAYVFVTVIEVSGAIMYHPSLQPKNGVEVIR